MKRAGVAITITSVTDMVAFGIGSLTEVPALKSFCTYACVGIFAIFLFQSTVFVAAMSLDQKVSTVSRSRIIEILTSISIVCKYRSVQVHDKFHPNLLCASIFYRL